MSALVIDIETAGEDWEKIDDSTKERIVKRIEKDKDSASLSEAERLELAKQSLGLSPYTGQIVAIGVLDTDTKLGGVYYQAPNTKTESEEISGIKFQVLTENEMLEKFWQLAAKYRQFVTFSGRTFDMPFILIRSAINKIKPIKDLLRGRYLYQQSPDASHIDLYDQLTFYGSFRFVSGGNLHMACRALGIATPKDDEIDGSKVSEFFKAGKYKEIARYNARDLEATTELFAIWQKYLAN